MTDSRECLRAARRVPGWPRRWFILFRLHDYLLGDAPALFSFWVRRRRSFWQYVMKVEESRVAREATPGGAQERARGEGAETGRLACRLNGGDRSAAASKNGRHRTADLIIKETPASFF